MANTIPLLTEGQKNAAMLVDSLLRFTACAEIYQNDVLSLAEREITVAASECDDPYEKKVLLAGIELLKDIQKRC